MHSLARVTLVLILPLLAAPGAARAAENQVPASQTTDAFIEALKPEPAQPAAPRTRGMAASAAPTTVAPPAPKSADLEVYFGFNSAQIAGDSLRRVDNLAAALRDPKLADGHFTVVGHTDAVGTREFNLKLSQLRADAVRDYLVGHGVSAERLRAVGKGFEQLKNSDDPTAEENRRVEIVAEY